MTTTPNARLRIAVLGVLAGLLLALVLPAAAASAAAYRYWGYYTLSGTTWQFATKGPEQTHPADGSVEGWRFAVGAEGDTRTPRAKPSFAELCARTKAESGKKRVGVVLDYGRSADAPEGSTPPKPKGTCALVAANATGAQVLATVASVRADKGLVCSIDSFPTTGCGEAVKTVSAAAKAPDQPVQLAMPSSDASSAATPASDSASSHTGTWIGIAVVVLLALAIALTLLRRRRAV